LSHKKDISANIVDKLKKEVLALAGRLPFAIINAHQFSKSLLSNTDVARNIDWEGLKIEKFCDVILLTFFGDVIVMTSLNLFKIYYSKTNDFILELSLNNTTFFRLNLVDL